MHPALSLVVAALHWDPQVRGILIVATGILVLPGSVYLLLATNTGGKVGFLLAVAGITGWILVMSIVWATFGIGLVGRVASWKVKEIDTGNISSLTTLKAMRDFPDGNGWRQLMPGTSEVADAQANSDKFLAPNGSPRLPGVTEGPAPPPSSRFTTGFKLPTDYAYIGVWRKGGDNQLFTLHRHKFYLRHSPHYDVVQVLPVAPAVQLPGGAPPKAIPDVTKPITTVVMVRDLGSLRQPPLFLALAVGLVFSVTCVQLHRRDKAVMAARAAGGAGGAGAGRPALA